MQIADFATFNIVSIVFEDVLTFNYVLLDDDDR